MAKTFKVKIVAPGKPPIDEEIESIIVESSDGDVEIKADHTPLILATVPSATLLIKANGENKKLFTSLGVLSMKNNVLNFCCDAYETTEEIDANRAENAKHRAEERLGQTKDVDLERAKRALARSMARIKVLSIHDR